MKLWLIYIHRRSLGWWEFCFNWHHRPHMSLRSTPLRLWHHIWFIKIIWIKHADTENIKLFLSARNHNEKEKDLNNHNWKIVLRIFPRRLLMKIKFILKHLNSFSWFSGNKSLTVTSECCSDLCSLCWSLGDREASVCTGLWGSEDVDRSAGPCCRQKLS